MTFKRSDRKSKPMIDYMPYLDHNFFFDKSILSRAKPSLTQHILTSTQTSTCVFLSFSKLYFPLLNDLAFI